MSENKFKDIWGEEFAESGITSFPNIVTDYASQFVTAKEFMLIVVLARHKYTSRDPFPSVKKIAEKLNIKPRQTQNLISSLQKKELLKVTPRYDDNGQTSNAYDLKPLLEKCLQELKENKSDAEELHGGGAENMHGGDAENMHPGDAQELHGGDAENMHPNNQENKQVLINKENNQSNQSRERNDLVNHFIQKHLGDVKSDWIDSIHNVYEMFSSQIDIHKFQEVIIDVAHYKSNIESIEGYLKKAIINKLNEFQEVAVTKEVKPTRREPVPGWLQQQFDDEAYIEKMKIEKGDVQLTDESLPIIKRLANGGNSEMKEVLENRKEASHAKFGF